MKPRPVQSLSLIAVRYAETDQMGVVHHSHYPVYFEQGRTDFFVEHLEHYQRFEEQGLYAPVLSLQFEILGRASYGDTLHLTTRPDWLRGVRIQMTYSIAQADGRLVARGSSLHALVNAQLRPVHPRSFAALYARLESVFSPSSPPSPSPC